MDQRKMLWLVVTLAAVAAPGQSIPHSARAKGRKLFGGYRIAPKPCQPTGPSRFESAGPSICMFNYECSRRSGEVVGACMDGFLFGACCQLPSQPQFGLDGPDDEPADPPTQLEELDHVPDIPILLNPDGTPSNHGDKPQLAAELEAELPALLQQQQLLDGLQLPTLLAPGQSVAATLLRPDQVLQLAEPVPQRPVAQDKVQPAETLLLDESGTGPLLESHDPDELFRPAGPTSSSSPSSPSHRPHAPQATLSMIDSKSSSAGSTTPVAPPTTRHDLLRLPNPSPNNKHHLDNEEIAINHIISILNDTGDAKLTTRVANGPTTYKWSSTDGSSSTPSFVKIITRYPSSSSSSSSSGGGSSATSTTHSYGSSPNYYHYKPVTEPSRLSSSYYSPSASSSFSSYSTQPASSYQQTSSGGFSSKPASTVPTTNPPAPTLIVLGPLNTEYTTLPSHSSSYSSTPALLATKKPTATLTHNISTVISGNKQVLSVSYISLDLKDATTTRPPTNSNVKLVTRRPPSSAYPSTSSWSSKPSFHLRPGVTTGGVAPTTTTSSNCDEETAATSDDVNNFPPVRHPELDSSVTQHLQDNKPTVVAQGELLSEAAIPTPDFVEDAELDNKVDVFVSKIVESLQGNFDNLKDVVYNPSKSNATSLGTRKPQAPAASSSSPKPSSPKPSRPKPSRPSKPSSQATRRPTTTGAIKRKPQTKSTTPPSPQLQSAEPLTSTTTTTTAAITTSTTAIPEITPNADFRSVCGIRPLVKTGRIVGGKGASFGEWPWQVLVREATWLGLFTKNKCGGVLITDKYVITAAHCQPGFLASLVAVFGDFDISGELEPKRSVSRNVRRVIVNRAYDPATFENDLALLELETPIQFDTHIVPICMPDDTTDYVNRMATVTGWGRLKYSGGVPSVLQEVKVPIIENSVCQQMFRDAGHQKVILESFMCAGYATGKKDSCEGDSGGPLTLQRPDGRWILVGTVSHGIKCAQPLLPGVYMRTTYFKPWLNTITGV